MSFLCFLCCKSNDWHVKTNWQAMTKYRKNDPVECRQYVRKTASWSHTKCVKLLKVVMPSCNLNSWACSTRGSLGSIKLQFCYTSGVVTEILSRCSLRWCQSGSVYGYRRSKSTFSAPNWKRQIGSGWGIITFYVTTTHCSSEAL